MRVRATKLGYFGVLRVEGAEFSIENDEHFSDSWMERVEGGDVPESKSSESSAVMESGGNEDRTRTVEDMPVSGLGVSLEEAIGIAVENGHVTDAGLPTITKLKEITGRDVTAAERDEAMNVGINQ